MTGIRRFPPETLASIRDRISIPSLLPSDSLRACGEQLRGRCPLPGHDDRDPSFYVSLEKRRFYCHGCRRGGDVIELHRLLFDSSFPDAVKLLLEISGESHPPAPTATVRHDRERPRYPIITAAHRAILEDVAERYREAAKGQRAFQRFLRGRGFGESHWRGLGFAPSAGIGLIDEACERIKILRELGLLDQRDGRLFERLRNGIVFAVTDLEGDVQGFVCRRIAGRPKYLNTRFPKRILPLGIAEARADMCKTHEVLLVEGPFDWLAMRAMGYQSVLALLGCRFSGDLAVFFKRIGVLRVRLCLDGDTQGQAGQQHARSMLRQHGIDAPIESLLGRCHDPASLWRRQLAAGRSELPSRHPITIANGRRRR